MISTIRWIRNRVPNTILHDPGLQDVKFCRNPGSIEAPRPLPQADPAGTSYRPPADFRGLKCVKIDRFELFGRFFVRFRSQVLRNSTANVCRLFDSPNFRFRQFPSVRICVQTECCLNNSFRRSTDGRLFLRSEYATRHFFR